MLTLLCLALAPIAQQSEEPAPALRGLDPVALCEGEEVPGEEALEERWGFHLYRFASEASRDTFRDEPERYAIQWDGGCGRMGPLSGKGSPDRWAVHAGRIFVFASEGCRDGFLADPDRFVTASEAVTANADELAAGSEWIERAVEAHGGAAVDAARALVLTEQGTSGGWQREHVLELTSVGDVERRSTWTPPSGDGAAPSDTRWSVPAAGTANTRYDGRTYALTSPEALEDVRRFAHREILFHLWARHREDFRAIDLGPGELGEQATREVLVQHQGLATTLHLHAENGRALGLSWRGRPATGETQDVLETFTTWRTVDGVELPTGRTVLADGAEHPSFSRPWTEVMLGG